MSADWAAVQVFAVKAHFSFYFASMTEQWSKNIFIAPLWLCSCVFLFVFYPNTCLFPTARVKTICFNFWNHFLGASKIRHIKSFYGYIIILGMTL